MVSLGFPYQLIVRKSEFELVFRVWVRRKLEWNVGKSIRESNSSNLWWSNRRSISLWIPLSKCVLIDWLFNIISIIIDEWWFYHCAQEEETSSQSETNSENVFNWFFGAERPASWAEIYLSTIRRRFTCILSANKKYNCTGIAILFPRWNTIIFQS